MKKLQIIIISLLILGTVSGVAQPTYSFRVTNPRILYNTNSFWGNTADHLQYDIQVMSSALSYMYTMQVIMSMNLPAFGVEYEFVPNAAVINPLNYSITFNELSNNINLFMTSSKGTATPNTLLFAALNTTWLTIGTVNIHIANPALAANIAFVPTLMDNSATNHRQTERTFPTGSRDCLFPNVYSGDDFTKLNLGRIYSQTSGWSQVGGAVAGVPFLNWATAVGTSVWDTGATAPSITVAGSKAIALCIHKNARLTIPPLMDLTCTGATDINAAKGVVLGANATGLGQFIDNGTITYNSGGTVETDLYIAQNSWHLYCIPLTSTLSRPYSNIYMRYYQEPTHHWKYIWATGFTPDTTLNTQMLGYAIWSDQNSPPMGNATVRPVGSLNTGAMTIPVTRADGTDGYNLVGNPYPSSIDLSSAGVTWNNTEPKAWFWDPSLSAGAGNYTVYIVAGGGTRVNQFAAPQQGFFVHHVSTDVISTSLGINNTARTINAVSFLKTDDEIADMINLTATAKSNGSFDKAVVRFASDATKEYDIPFDAYKIYGDFAAPQLYSLLEDKTPLTVNALPWDDDTQVVPLGFSCGVSGDFRIEASNLESFRAGVQVLLEDLKLHTIQELNINPAVEFSYAAGDDPNRFLLHFINPYNGIQEQTAATIQIFSNDQDLYVKNLLSGILQGTVYVYDLTGRKVFESSLGKNLIDKFRLPVNEGYYLVKVISKDQVVTKKVHIN